MGIHPEDRNPCLVMAERNTTTCCWRESTCLHMLPGCDLRVLPRETVSSCHPHPCKIKNSILWLRGMASTGNASCGCHIPGFMRQTLRQRGSEGTYKKELGTLLEGQKHGNTRGLSPTPFLAHCPETGSEQVPAPCWESP